MINTKVSDKMKGYFLASEVGVLANSPRKWQWRIGYFLNVAFVEGVVFIVVKLNGSNFLNVSTYALFLCWHVIQTRWQRPVLS